MLEKGDIIRKVQYGERPDLSLLEPGTPSEIIDLIKACWDEHKNNRMTDDLIVETLKKLVLKK